MTSSPLPPSHHRHPQHQAAFSLTEILIALGIIAFSLVTIFGLFAAPLKTSITNQNETAASLIAHHILSHFQAYGNIPNTTYYFDENIDITDTPDEAIYQASIETTPQTFGPINTDQITLTIRLLNAPPTARPIATFTTLIPNPTPPTPPSSS
jgi:type II secretory pathway pseudopilin PulG